MIHKCFHFFILMVLISGIEASAQRGTITIQTGQSIIIPSGSQICADTIIVNGSLLCADASCVCSTVKIICNGTVTPTSLCGASSGPVLTAQTSLDFGVTSIGQPVTRILTIQNTGTLPLIITGVSIAPAGLFTIVSGGGAQTIQPGLAGAITLQYLPSSIGTQTSTLTIANNSPNQNFTVSLSGTCTAGAGANAVLSDTSIDFGKTLLSQPVVRSITVQNTGSATLTVSSQTLQGGDAGLFTLTHQCPGQLLSGQSDSIQLRFVPTSRGVKGAQLVLQTNDPNKATITIQLDGQGTAPAITVSSTLAFNDVTVGTNLTKGIVVSNSGDATLQLTAGSIGGANGTDFAVQTAFPLSIDSGKNQTIDLKFTPSSQGVKSATFTVSSNDPATPNAVISLTGNGTSAALPHIAVVSTVDFGTLQPAQSNTRDIQVTNTGSAALSISSQTVQGQGFSLALSSGTPIQPSNTSTARIQFNPGAVGSYAGSFIIVSNDPSSPTITVQLHGSCSTGSTDPRISLSSTSINFGMIVAGSHRDTSIVVSNIGSSDLLLKKQSIEGQDALDFSIVQTAGTIIASNASSTIIVRHRPITTGGKIAVIVIESNDKGMPRFEVGLVSNVTTAVERLSQAPTEIRLHQNYPNPFNPATSIEYEIDKRCKVTLIVSNIMGHEITRLDDGMQEPGVYRATWNAAAFPNGVYVAELHVTTEQEQVTHRRFMVLTK
jgi:hypothetical protein